MAHSSRAQTTFVDPFKSSIPQNDTKTSDHRTNHVSSISSESRTHRKPGMIIKGSARGMQKRSHRSKASSSRSKSLFDSRDMDRRKRIAKYKMYATKGRVKNTFKEGIRWINRKCSKITHYSEFWILDQDSYLYARVRLSHVNIIKFFCTHACKYCIFVPSSISIHDTFQLSHNFHTLIQNMSKLWSSQNASWTHSTFR